MKRKMGVIFVILFVMLFSLAAVAANDVNDADTIGEVTEEQTIENVDVLKSTDTQIDENSSSLAAEDEDTLSADEGSFKDLQDLIDGAGEGTTIYLNKDYAFKDTDTVEFSKSITIDGKGHYLDGQGKDRIFDIELEKNTRVVLKNITFKNGDVSWTSGGAIRCEGIKYNEGSLYVTGCTFDNNHADDAGAIYAEYINAYIENCRFTNNAADDHGGAIVLCSRDSTIVDCYFENNNAEDCGGAIDITKVAEDPRNEYIRDNQILFSTFINNHGDNGGAIYANGCHNMIRNCNFYKNHANDDGGAICGYTDGGGDDFIEYCIFEENSADSTGGAIYFDEFDPAIYYSIFNKNTAELGKDVSLEWCPPFYTHDHGSICTGCIFLTQASIYHAQRGGCWVNGCWFPNGYDFQGYTEYYVVKNYNELNLKFEYVKNVDSPYIITGYFTFQPTSQDPFNFPLREFTIETTTGTINTTKINIGLNKSSFEYTPDYAFDKGEITFKFMNYTHVFKFDQILPGSFSALQHNISYATNTLTLDSDFSYSENGDSHIGSEGILIDKTLTINGKGYTINGNGRTAFKINNPSASVTFNDITFVNCNIPINTINAQKITFNNCTFEENNENIIISTDCEFNDCQFLDNVAQDTSILYIAGDCVFNNATFVNNVAGESLIILNSTSNVEINDSLFIQNDADKIIHIKKTLDKLNVTNNIIINSESEYEIYAESQPQECYLDYNWFGNTADNFNSPYKVNLDADTWYFLNITLMPDYANISLNNIYDNVNKRAIRNSDYTLSNISIKLDFVNMTSSQESIDFDDDGEVQINVYMLSKPAFLTASYENVNYTVNLTQKGDFDLLIDLISTAENSTIVLDRDYTFTEGLDSVGGITVMGTNMVIDGNGHTINALGKSLLFNVFGDKITLKNLIVVNGCNEDLAGNKGPIVWSGSEGVIDNCTFENNTGFHNGAITWTGQNGLIKDSIFKGNAAENGGAIYIAGKNMTVINATFTNNRAESGGAIYVYAKDVAVENSTFKHNTASRYGGAVYWNKHEGNISGCEFDSNSATDDGGAIYWNAANSVVTASNFTSNNAEFGGAVYWNKGNGSIFDCVFDSNSATKDGGAVYWNDNDGKVTGSTFINNTATRDGGAICWDGENCIVSSSNFTSNKARSGGAIYWNQENDSVFDCVFDSNSATKDGGAICWNDEHGKVTRSTFINNTAAQNGGAIYFERDAFLSSYKYHTVDNSVFLENSAQNGGAIYLLSGESSIENSLFVKNQATKGGALYGTSDDGSILKLIFINNTASEGSAIYTEESSTPVNYCIFINNGENTIFFKDTSTFGSELNADYNWFGNNITNSNAAPSVSNKVVCNYWYVMDMTMADGIANIRLNNVYDNKYHQLLIEQSCTLPQINFTLTNENLEIAGIASLNENGKAPVSYKPTSTQTSLTAKYDIVQITVNKDYLPGTVIIGDKDEFDYGNVSIEFSVENPTTMEIIIKNEDNETVLNITTDERILKPDLAVGTYTITITNAGNDTVLQSNASKTFKVNQATPKISVVATDVTYPGDLIVNVTSDVSGRYTVNVGDQQTEIDLVANIIKNVPFTGLSANEYTIIVSYNETENYTAAVNDTVKVSVSKVTPTIAVSAESIIYPGDVIVGVVSDVSGKYTVKVGNQIKVIDLLASVAKNVTFAGLSANEYTIIVSYNETENYTAAVNDTVKVSVSKVTPTIAVSAESVIYPGDVIVGVVSDVSGKYTVKVGNQQTEIDLVANVAKNVTFAGLSANEYTIIVSYNETENYTHAVNDTVKVSVLKATPTITVSAENVTYPGDVIITIGTDANCKFNITVGNQTKEETLKAGTNTVTFTGVKVGNYTVIVSCVESENYTSAINNNTNISVLKNEAFEPEISATNTANETIITFTFPEDATGNVTVTIDGKQYNATVENGKATITTPLIPLDSTVDFEYSGDANYPAKSKKTSIANVTAIIKATDMTRGYNSGVDYQVTVVDGNGNPMAKKQLIFIINGKEYNATTNEKGVAILNLKLAIGTYKITTKNPLNNDNVTKTVKITTRITGNKNVNTYYGKNYAYKLRIIGDNGKAVGSNVAVKVTVNGKAKTLKTDKNGYITLKFTKNYLPKTYTVTAEYKGIKVTNKVKVKQILTLKKVKVKKSAKKLILKATLKEGKKALKNKKVTFKFKGKKYKAKTNKKGIAKVKIKKSVLKKLKVGKKVKYQVTYLKDTVKRSVKVKK